MRIVLTWIVSVVAILLGSMPTASAVTVPTDAEFRAMAEYLNSVNQAREGSQNSVRKKIQSIMLSSLPTTVSQPSFTGTFSRYNESATLTFFRAQGVGGETRLFVQVIPQTSTFFFCPSGSQFNIIQNGRDYGQAFRVTYGDNNYYCGNLPIPSIFLVDQWSIYTNFDVLGAFKVISSSAYTTGSVSVAAFSGGATSSGGSTTGCASTPMPSSDYTATFKGSSGELLIPRVGVPSALGTAYYNATLKVVPLSDPLRFELTGAAPAQ